ncbi:RNA polymerase sigma factor [Agriterribacter sp.]|uniref:RNA polymerase sigma factor n=1 Tax=Agriterribacter sp. TaxID=2821509 RepID=UPI002C90C07A|nr:RNA polymerase sigma factor [Agriterribacter sp.]HRO46452.1 RNA polymerase sigma factor [Agriterribacter sp.]HRQ17351.1 RNA polymerase sigma factor [Agriterribacter sp.]
MDHLTILPPSQLSDTELVNRVLSGEKHLFEWIMRRYNQRLFRAGIAILGDDMEVEDAMQNAYINAYQHLAKFEHRASLSTWLIKILINECLAQKNKKAHFKVVNIEYHPENMSSMKTPSHILMNKEMGIALEAAIAHLPEKYRLVFMLREIEALPVKETGDILGIEEANVKVRLNRAKAMLRRSLGDDMKAHVYTFHLTRCDRLVNYVLNCIA